MILVRSLHSGAQIIQHKKSFPCDSHGKDFLC
ncbi:MAG: hypothetical protein H6Q60_458, partial [Oscillospiraceae bacterium]|nr:hypothetical protein [Oscillospiraceae bacterium]